jgi:hypothetical protein
MGIQDKNGYIGGFIGSVAINFGAATDLSCYVFRSSTVDFRYVKRKQDYYKTCKDIYV